jgi:hypothetical protein
LVLQNGENLGGYTMKQPKLSNLKQNHKETKIVKSKINKNKGESFRTKGTPKKIWALNR